MATNSVPPVRAVTGPGPLRQPGFRWYLTARTVSLLGSAMMPVAMTFAVLEVSGSAADLGAVLASFSVALVAFMLLGGVLSDRFTQSQVLTVSNLGLAVVEGTVAALLVAGVWNLPVMVVLNFLVGVLTAFSWPAGRGIVPHLVTPDQVQRANSLLGSVRNGINVLGPVVGGLAAATIGGGWVIALDALSFVVAALCVTRIDLPRQPLPAGTSMVTQLREGWQVFRRTTWVWSICAAFAVTNFVQVGIWNVLGPKIALATVGAAGWGTVLGARAVGLLIASVVMYRLTVSRPLRVERLVFALAALPLIAVGLHAGLAWLVASAFVAGLASEFHTVVWETSLQEHMPRQALSRVASYDGLVSNITMPLGQAAAIPIAAAVGDTRYAVVGGAVFVLATLLPLASAPVRDLRHARAVPDTEPAGAV